MATKSTRKKSAPKAAAFGTLSDEEIMKRAEEIAMRNKPALERMPISSPENARAYLKACGYKNLPPDKPNF